MSGPATHDPLCCVRTCPAFGSPGFGEGTCPAEHAGYERLNRPENHGCFDGTTFYFHTPHMMMNDDGVTEIKSIGFADEFLDSMTRNGFSPYTMVMRMLNPSAPTDVV